MAFEGRRKDRPSEVGKVPSNRNFSTTTTTTDANQSIGSYAVPSGRTYVLVGILVEVTLVTPTTTLTSMGLFSIRFGTVVIMGPLRAVQNSAGSPFGFSITIPDDTLRFFGDGSTALNAICTPDVANVQWRITLLGYEK